MSSVSNLSTMWYAGQDAFQQHLSCSVSSVAAISDIKGKIRADSAAVESFVRLTFSAGFKKLTPWAQTRLLDTACRQAGCCVGLSGRRVEGQGTAGCTIRSTARWSPQ